MNWSVLNVVCFEMWSVMNVVCNELVCYEWVCYKRVCYVMNMVCYERGLL